MSSTSDAGSDPGGTINSDRVGAGIARDQAIEGVRQDAEDASVLLTDNGVGDEEAPADQGSAGAAGPGRHVGP